MEIWSEYYFSIGSILQFGRIRNLRKTTVKGKHTLIQQLQMSNENNNNI